MTPIEQLKEDFKNRNEAARQRSNFGWDWSRVASEQETRNHQYLQAKERSKFRKWRESFSDG